ncbi:MAG: chromosome segregation protein SMC [Actinobacteria bacterium]|nr:chromosome segregation protein SMC [Actinomycetota bacterium]
MYLKALTLKGFKSFSEATRVELEPGVTVVVGPNGSGKSNVVDAVAWVLGAQGPRTLRSSKMEDVIFAGSANKPALGRAEVTLTIDNSSGLLPVDLAEVTITRTLFRSGDSEYALNGATCRLLDIQELLSDTGVGRTQHVIVSQGNLEALLDARPEDRRAVIEEAAGVLKYRRRRERSQRRLESADADLLRLNDVVREVKRQLGPLERQATAARRHDEVAAELSALRRWLAGRELRTLRARLESAAASGKDLAAAQKEITAQLSRLDADIATSEEALAARGHEDISEVLVTTESLRERARGLMALCRERARSIERQRQSVLAADAVASMREELEKVEAALREVEDAAAQFVPRLAELETREAELSAERQAAEATWAELTPDSRLSEVRGELTALHAAAERAQADHARQRERRDALAERRLAITNEVERQRSVLEETTRAEAGLVEAVDTAEAAHAVAAAEFTMAEARLRTVEKEASRATARVEALGLALAETSSSTELAAAEGLIGRLGELVEIEPGWESAVEAAAGNVLWAWITDGPQAAMRALEAHTADSGTLTVIPLPTAGDNDTPATERITEGDLVRPHVSAPSEALGLLLDRVLANVVRVSDWQAAADLIATSPDLIAVTADGDRFAADGWRVGRGSASPAALAEARRVEDEVRARLAQAEEAYEHAARIRSACEDRAAEAAAALDANDGRTSNVISIIEQREAELMRILAEEDLATAHLQELSERSDVDADRVRALEETLARLHAEDEAVSGKRDEARALQADLDRRAASLATSRTELQVMSAGVDERCSGLVARRDEILARLGSSGAEDGDRGSAERSAEALAGAARAATAMEASANAHVARLDETLGRLRETRRRHTESVRAAADRLESLRRERAASESELSKIRERAQRAELDEAEVRIRMESAVETLRRDLECEPEEAEAAALEAPPVAEGVAPVARSRELERELRLMGPVNPLALEEYEALRERHEFLTSQITDVKQSRRELVKVINAIDADIQAVFSAAFVDVADNFGKLFQTLFPGGTGRLRLTDPDNLLETGIEVEARPSGKSVKRLSLLSGGERSLVALAFLFAVFRSRPSPFYLLDEVEAALDDVNLHRFLALVDEFRNEAQMIIVSHQKRTMEAADCLYGVTMPPGGSSKVVSQRVRAGV